jgi:hypothetical protein
MIRTTTTGNVASGGVGRCPPARALPSANVSPVRRVFAPLRAGAATSAACGSRVVAADPTARPGRARAAAMENQALRLVVAGSGPSSMTLPTLTRRWAFSIDTGTGTPKRASWRLGAATAELMALCCRRPGNARGAGGSAKAGHSKTPSDAGMASGGDVPEPTVRCVWR